MSGFSRSGASTAAPGAAIPGYSYYFISGSTFQKPNILQSDRMAGLFLAMLVLTKGPGQTRAAALHRPSLFSTFQQVPRFFVFFVFGFRGVRS